MKLETPPPSPIRPLPSRPRRHWRAAIVGLVALGVAGGAWVALRPHGPAPAAAKEDGPAKVAVYELARGDVAAVEARALGVDLPLSGSLTPQTQATVKAKASGTVLEAAPQEGMAVAAGQVLARLDAGDLNARLTQQQAALDEARAKLSIAQKNEANNLALLKQKYISQTAYDTTQNSVELARASVKSADALVEIARIALADTVIRAPLAGIVSRRHVQAGDKLAPDMPAYTIVNLARLTLEAQVPAAEIPRVKVGQEVRFRVDGFGQRDFLGKVERINPTAEAGSRAMLVYIAVDNADATLRGGMFAKGHITTERSAVAPLLPLAALRADGQVYAIENGKVVARSVQLGLRNEDEGYVEVRQGLAAGASVIVTRLDGVKPGSAVKVAGAAAPAKPALLAQKG
ncbi:MAG TPA: efflux RND transporter periplasmic adaptor subunit [Janthinobacterium sp.]|nr:efflux RND transporter periplasmic adaptor subunit [Janthinobacterium sp.]